jgi:patatin-like phospholipase/acyl hydrolase
MQPAPHYLSMHVPRSWKHSRSTVRILSIDGGGIRGLIPALVLAHLRGRLDEHGKTAEFHELFNLMAGTSTGGLITIGLSTPKPDPEDQERFVNQTALSIDDIKEIYLEKGEVIFPRSTFRGLRRLGQVLHEKYSPEPIRDLMEELLGKATLKDSLCHLLVTSYDMAKGTVFLFKNRPERKDRHQEDPNFYLKDIALATSAAPTYFEPVRIQPIGHDGASMCLVDGGIFAANPAMCAYIEARKTFRSAKRFLILSLGTGIVTKRYPCREINTWGYLEWVNPARGAPLLSAMSTGQSECVDHQLHKLPGVEYFRIDGKLGEEHVQMDDASPANLAGLKAAAQRIIRENEDSIEQFCRKL